MAKVEVYSSMFCGFCHKAKKLLKTKGVKYNDIDVMMNPGRREEMMKRAKGGRTVPQIFINDRHVGGCQELYQLEAKGELDDWLAGKA